MVSAARNKMKSFCDRYFLHSSQLSVAVLCFFSFSVSSQTDTTEFEGVTVEGNHPLIENHSEFKRKRILELSPEDLGVLLKRTTGATIADYGGIGSLKSMSMRGMGSSHTGLVINGFGVSMAQQAQIDFSRVQVSNIEKAQVILKPTGSINLPVSAQMKGSSVSIETFEYSFSPKSFELRTSTTIGSFGRKEFYTGLKTSLKNSFISFSGNLKAYQGDFKFTLPYSEDIERLRSNNSRDSYDFSLGGGKKWNYKNTNHRIRFFGTLNHINRELPGAVIYYNTSNNEELTTQQKRIGIDYSLLRKQLKVRLYGNLENQLLRYYDPEYFNNQGFIDNRYDNFSVQSGFNLTLQIGKFNLHAGNDLKNQELLSSRDLGSPERLNNVAMISSSFKTKLLRVSGGIYHHFISDNNRLLAHSNDYSKWNPQISLQTSDKLFEKIQFSAWYKHSSRAPSFNELYYAQIGNTELVPEESEQINLGYHWVLDESNYKLGLSGNTFYNRIANKIVALPTQNMFIWSIQNVGEVRSIGADINLNVTFKINDYTSIRSNIGVTYQSVRDHSNPNSPTYRHQIANTPEWSQNSDVQLQWKKFSLGVSSIFMGQRYSLNQNIPMNELENYLVFDLNIGYDLKLAKKHNFIFQFGIKNIADRQYYHINYFVMPGRHYFLKIAYEI